ncbi:MAG TPA: glucan endo-1,3-beta-D-glucosidase [Treponema sp.]|nr:glucan endo-1,3-beta-D-glucosidase [Treponema sp.]
MRCRNMLLFCLALSGTFMACQKKSRETYEIQNSKYTMEDIVWQDDFDGRKLNKDDWNYEYHEPGWVNSELQEYVDSAENIYVKDGTLVIQALKHEQNGAASYTSGRINTRGKHDFTYGRFEARLKVPRGQGFLPAFWMMPTEENLYGQWPKCGEIDIMEVLGNRTDTQYGTIHFGEPHAEHQGSYSKFGTDLSKEFHIYACEWDPGEIRFYIDNMLFYKTSDWFTKKKGFGEVAYPAPFDQPFYLILNVAVGGNWPGNPTAETGFAENARMVVDYVRVYQKPSYNEAVSKPEAPFVQLREPDATGNFVANGDFAVAENLGDTTDWFFLLAGSGKGSADISGNALHVTSEMPGDLDYSIQIVQPDIPLEKGSAYHYQFDAWADDERTIITAITAPNVGWIRYLNDTKVPLGKKKQTFAFDFTMKEDSDPTGRIEFNLGNQNATAKVHITNVRFVKTGAGDASDAAALLPDGNYVFNGEFQEGAGRLAHWETDTAASVGVTNEKNVRELKLAPSGTAARVFQSVAVQPGKTYILSFDAYSPDGAALSVGIEDALSLEVPLTGGRASYRYTFEPSPSPSSARGRLLTFAASVGTVFVDSVRIQDDGMIVNGDFSSGLTGYEVYAHEEASLEYGIDSLTYQDAFCADISNTGSADWMIQLKQNNITLENGKSYRVAFDAKSTLERSIMYALQRDGSGDDNWIPYSGTQIIQVGPSVQHYETVFQMQEKTDPAVILSISMGAVNGKRIDAKHTVVIDNIVVEERN